MGWGARYFSLWHNAELCKPDRVTSVPTLAVANRNFGILPKTTYPQSEALIEHKWKPILMDRWDDAHLLGGKLYTVHVNSIRYTATGMDTGTETDTDTDTDADSDARARATAEEVQPSRHSFANWTEPAEAHLNFKSGRKNKSYATLRVSSIYVSGPASVCVRICIFVCYCSCCNLANFFSMVFVRFFFWLSHTFSLRSSLKHTWLYGLFT